MIIYTLPTGEKVHRYLKSIVIPFTGKRSVLSTSHINGGYQEDLRCVYNHDSNPGAGMACSMKADTIDEHMKIITKEIGLDPETTAGIATAASMDNVAIRAESFDEIEVTAIVTGGIEVNGGRVGDSASWHEKNGKHEQVKPGTINIILHINGNLPAETMTRALVTCTEAKTAAIQELMEGSKYSNGLATGSGTDGTIVIANAESENIYNFAGKHCKLGELIGRAVKSAVKEALYLQTGLCPELQKSVIRRTQRFGISHEKLWEAFARKEQVIKPDYIEALEKIDRIPELVVASVLYVHLLDQLNWGLLSSAEIEDEISKQFKQMAESLDVEMEASYSGSQDKDSFIEKSIQDLSQMLNAGIERRVLCTE
ncbi:adenosylcobinamide amidohydrolase [Eubacteriaceae bacterium ES3]|nr:adenosylcobinamide amidohydrolase [Eubacteriaceae bacterium ES3]